VTKILLYQRFNSVAVSFRAYRQRFNGVSGNGLLSIGQLGEYPSGVAEALLRTAVEAVRLPAT
jgi:hypothetical protein